MSTTHIRGLDEIEIRRLGRGTIDRNPLDSWTPARLAAHLALPALPVAEALAYLIARGVVVVVDGEYLSVHET